MDHVSRMQGRSFLQLKVVGIDDCLDLRVQPVVHLLHYLAPRCLLDLLYSGGESINRFLQSQRRLIGHVTCQEANERAVDAWMPTEPVLQIQFHTSVGLQSDLSEPRSGGQLVGDVRGDSLVSKIQNIVADLHDMVG